MTQTALVQDPDGQRDEPLIWNAQTATRRRAPVSASWSATLGFVGSLMALTVIMTATVSASVTFFVGDDYVLGLFMLGPALASSVGVLGIQWRLVQRATKTQTPKRQVR